MISDSENEIYGTYQRDLLIQSLLHNIRLIIHYRSGTLTTLTFLPWLLRSFQEDEKMLRNQKFFQIAHQGVMFALKMEAEKCTSLTHEVNLYKDLIDGYKFLFNIIARFLQHFSSYHNRKKKNPILEEKKNRLLLPYWFLEIFFSHPKKEETLKSMICTLNVTKPSSSYEKLLSTYFKHSVHVCVSAYIYV